LSVFITMYPFVSHEDLIRIFKANLYTLEESIPIIRELAGLESTKPFECVGTTEEIIAALWLAIDRLQGLGESLPLALRYVSEHVLPRFPDPETAATKILSSYGPHRIPSKVEAMLKTNLGF